MARDRRRIAIELYGDDEGRVAEERALQDQSTKRAKPRGSSRPEDDKQEEGNVMIKVTFIQVR